MDDVDDSRWRVLPVGRPETLRRTATEAALFGLIGLGGLFAMAVATGVVIEEVFSDTDEGITTDLVLRASLAGIGIFGLAGLLALGVLGALQGLSTARGLTAAARQGTPATEVPTPDQWEAATESSGGAYKLLALWVLALLGLGYVLLVWAVLEDPDPTGLAMLAGGGLLLLLIWSGIPFATRVLDPRQAVLAAGLERRWTQAHRERAAERELVEEEIGRARTLAGLAGRLPGQGARSANQVLICVVIVALEVWGIALHVGMSISHPDRTLGPSAQAGDRASLSPADELLVDRIELGGGVAAAVGVLAFALMVGCEILIWRAERRELRRALAEDGEVPPPHALLRRAMVSACPPGLRLGFGVAAAALALGFGLWFVSMAAEWPDWEHYHAASKQLRDAGSLGPWIMLGALVVLGLGVALGSQLDTRDEELRDQLVQRWPVRPPEVGEASQGEADESADGATDTASDSTPA